MFKDLSGAREYVSNGLYGLRSMGDPGLFRGVFWDREEFTPGEEKKELLFLFLEKKKQGKKGKAAT